MVQRDIVESADGLTSLADPNDPTPTTRRIGIASDEVLYRDGWDDDALNDEIARLLEDCAVKLPVNTDAHTRLAGT